MSDRKIPKYMQLKRELLSWLESGRLAPGAQFPSENEIAEKVKLSRQTVRQTFGELEKEGWLTRIQGKGTFARICRPLQAGSLPTRRAKKRRGGKTAPRARKGTRRQPVRTKDSGRPVPDWLQRFHPCDRIARN